MGFMEYCLADAKEKGKSGVCMLGAKKQKAWLSNQSFAKTFGFEVVLILPTMDMNYWRFLLMEQRQSSHQM